MPSPSPTFSSDTVYALSNGSDTIGNDCSSQQPCYSLDFTADCLLEGGGETDNTVCDGSYPEQMGTIRIDEREVTLSEKVIPIYRIGDIRFIGAGSHLTIINVIERGSGPTYNRIWFKTGTDLQDGYMSLEGFTFKSNRSTNDTILSINNAIGRGTMYIKDVYFDGSQFTQNKANQAMFSFIGINSRVTFENCTFINMDTMFEFKNGANGEFIDCIFRDNNLTKDYFSGTYQNPTPLFYINGTSTTLTFIDCVIMNNHFARNAIHIQNGGNLIMNNTVWSGNTAEILLDIPMIIATSSINAKPSIINVIQSEFVNNTHFSRIFELDTESYTSLYLQSTSFLYNSVEIDIEFVSECNGGMYIDDCRFVDDINNLKHNYCILLEGTNPGDPMAKYPKYPLSNVIQNTVWSNYFVYDDIIYSDDNAANLNLINITMRNIIGRGIQYTEANILSITNSTFYNVQKVTPSSGIWAGGVLYAPTTGANIQMSRVRFEKSNAINGGAIYLLKPGANTILERLTFIDNRATTAADLYISDTAAFTTASPLNAPGPHTVIRSIGSFHANSIFLQRRSGTFTMLFQDWTFINCTGNTEETATIYLAGIQAKFYDNVIKGNQRGIVRFKFYETNNVPVHVAPYFDFRGNVFQDNYNMESIFYYEPDVYGLDGVIQFIRDNVFDNNKGAILNNISFNYTDTLQGEVNISHIIIRNYDDPGYPLFSFSSSEDSCTSPADGVIHFEHVVFQSNRDTQLLNIECVGSQIIMNNFNFSDNDLSTRSAPNESIPIIYLGKGITRSDPHYWIMDNNQGIIIQNTGSINIINHQVTNHKGVYWVYEPSEDNVNNKISLSIRASNFSRCDVTALHPNYGLITFYGTPSSIYNTTISMGNIDFSGNVGTLIHIKPNGFLSTGNAFCPLTSSGESSMENVRFINNDAREGNLIYLEGISIYFAKDVIFEQNICSTETCLKLLEGWYTISNFEISEDIDTNFMTFGHEYKYSQLKIYASIQQMNHEIL